MKYLSPSQGPAIMYELAAYRICAILIFVLHNFLQITKIHRIPPALLYIFLYKISEVPNSIVFHCHISFIFQKPNICIQPQQNPIFKFSQINLSILAVSKCYIKLRSPSQIIIKILLPKSLESHFQGTKRKKSLRTVFLKGKTTDFVSFCQLIFIIGQGLIMNLCGRATAYFYQYFIYYLTVYEETSVKVMQVLQKFYYSNWFGIETTLIPGSEVKTFFIFYWCYSEFCNIRPNFVGRIIPSCRIFCVPKSQLPNFIWRQNPSSQISFRA